MFAAELFCQLDAQVAQIDELIELVGLGIPMRQQHLVVIGLPDLDQQSGQFGEAIHHWFQPVQVDRSEVDGPAGRAIERGIVVDVTFDDRLRESP
jgi:hypothetical protein